MDRFENMNYENNGNETNNVSGFEENRTENENSVNAVNEQPYYEEAPKPEVVGEFRHESSPQQFTQWENSSYIREYTPVSENIHEDVPEQYGYETVDEDMNQNPYYENVVEENAEEPVRFFNETVKKSGLKKYVAIAVAAGIVNLAALGGIYFVGYKMGSSQQVSYGDNGASGKNELMAILNETTGSNTAGASQTVNQGMELSTVDISKKVGPAVVGITSTIESNLSFFGGSAFSEGTGSGIIISADGYIVTNNHVIEGASAVSVTLNTGSEYEAEVIGADSKTDLAVLKISPNEQLTVAELGDSSALEVGERAVAIGNPLGMEFFGSTTQGIISAINRTITVDNKTMSVIQTDAAINEGNSGGALVNDRGQVIGINAVKIQSSSVEGMGFAIPISEAKPVISDLIEYGYVKGRPVIGISTRDVTEYMAKRQNWPMGVQVMETQIGTGAEIAGLRQGDIITKVDGKEIKTVAELNEVKNAHKPGDTLTFEVYKYETGLKTTVNVKLGEERPE